jgi:ubiquitin carboxyl-terminal hydrolase L3
VTIEPESALQKFQEQSIGSSSSSIQPFALMHRCVALTPQERAKLLETTELFASAHAAAASGGQSRMPEGGKVNEHFVAFVQAPDPTQPGKHRLIELDGRRSCAADLGECTELLTVCPLLGWARIPVLTFRNLRTPLNSSRTTI